MAENAVDSAHFLYLHGTAGMPRTTAEAQGPRLHVLSETRMTTPMGKVTGSVEADEETEAVVLIGEIGGSAEEEAATYIAEHVTKPVVGYIAGFTAPPGRKMGHAGAIISGSAGTAAAKQEALEEARVTVVDDPALIGEAVARVL